ncbi:UPF0496 protein At4g34320-like [Syzygium oleosum]|uniref:UPF0496 protein At4g34320-like n=1 Tax=Syzygium oleosum TaxID=219896 RepID=UPI0024BAF6E1|nr:UPF0496 protein At4g34320-like [Syzygium oleosum]
MGARYVASQIDCSGGIRRAIGVPEMNHYLRFENCMIDDEKPNEGLLDVAINKIKVTCRSMGDTNTRRNLPELFELVGDDLPNGLHTPDFCVTLENCLKYVRDVQLLIFDVLHCFEEEDKKGDCRETRDPLTEFFEIFQIIHKQQKSMLEKLQIKKEEIDEKLKSIRTWAIVSNIILIATFQAMLIYSVVTAAVVAPPFTAALVAAVAFPMDSVGKWIDSLWKNYEDILEGEEEVINSMQVLDTIRVLIDRLEVQIKSLLQIADFAIEGGPEAVKLGIEDIRKKLRDFVKDVEELEKQADKCFRGL